MRDAAFFFRYLFIFLLGIYPIQKILSQDQPIFSGTPCDSVPILKIGLIADPQYCDYDAEGNRYYRETLNKLPEAIDTLNKYQVDFVMNLGDMIDRYENSYDSVVQFYYNLNMPWYNLLGNHGFSEVSEAYLDSILQRYGMPYFYYNFSYADWQFIVLDGTELAEYSRYLHPELAGEGDSLWLQVQGQVNALPWNGGISRNQQLWMRSKLQEALDDEQNVILFCHFPVYPDSMRLGLWNDSVIVNLLEDYPNVIAYINGHEHNGNYGFRNNIHYYTQKAMVDYPDKNSFSILQIFRHEIRIKGFGNVLDTIWYYSDIKKKPLIFDVSDSILHYSHRTGSFVGKFIPDTAQEYNQVEYFLTDSPYENEYFSIRNDSLFFNSEIDLSEVSDIRVEVLATGCEFDSTAEIFQFSFDTASAYFHYQLSDTLLSVYDQYIVVLDSFLTDYSRKGLEYKLISSDNAVISVSANDSVFNFVPLKTGQSEIEFSITDTYKDKSYIFRFNISVYDPLNHPPEINDTSELHMFVLLHDTLRIELNQIFSDPDGDDLFFNYRLADTTFFALNLNNSVLKVYAHSIGYSECELTADDQRGGISITVLELEVNQNPVRISNYEEYKFPYEAGYFPDILLDTVYTDPDDDTLEFQITGSDFTYFLVDEFRLEICPDDPGGGSIYLMVNDTKNGILYDTLNFSFVSELTLAGPAANSQSGKNFRIYPNPSRGTVTLVFDQELPGSSKIILHDASGRVVQEEILSKGSVSKYLIPISKDLKNGIYRLQIITNNLHSDICSVILIR